MTSHLRSSAGRRHLLMAACALAAALPVSAPAQERYPQRAITLVVPFAPGGIADVTARAVADSMAKTLGKPVVVDNRPSAGSIVASQAVAKAAPDGHTLLLMTNSNAVSVGLFKKLPYDTVKDFAPVSTLGFFDLGVFVPSGSRFTSLGDLLKQAKEQPNQLKIATISVGTTQHLAAELFQSMAGIKVTLVPYKGTPAVLVALRSGEVDAAMEIVGPMLPQVNSNALRLLAVTGDRPNPAVPSAPLVQQSGVAGYNVASWNAIAAPVGTPAPVMERLGEAVRQALASPTVRSNLEPLGIRVQGSTPTQTKDFLVAEIKRWSDVLRAAKIEPQ